MNMDDATIMGEKPKNDDRFFESEKGKRSKHYELAGLGTRLVALWLDGLILGFITGILVGYGRVAGGGLGFLIGAAYYAYFFSQHEGRTLGKMLFGIRVIKTTGEPLTAWDGVVRYFGYYVNSFVLGLGWLWAMFDANSQGWHDKIANTYVVKG